MVTSDRIIGQAGATEKWDRILFGSDDDLVLPVSIYVGSNEEADDLIASVVELLRAYGFGDVQEMYQAPGSLYVHGQARFETRDHVAARRNKKELKEELGGKRARTARRHEAIQNLKGSLWKRTQKKVSAAVLAGAFFLGGLVGGAVKDALADELKDLAKENAPKVVQVMKVEIKELPQQAAEEFHRLVREYVANSPEKSEVKLAPPPPAE